MSTLYKLTDQDGYTGRGRAALATQSQPRVAGDGQSTPPVNQNDGADHG